MSKREVIMLKLNTIMLGSDNPKRLADFYGTVLQAEAGWESGQYIGYEAGSCYLMFGPHDHVHGRSGNPERIIFNFEAADVDSEFERVQAIEGASVVQAPYHPGDDSTMTLATFADPDGNYFQLASPMS
jgi:predicted enzyme related to lactoylglutathione lyase